MTQWHMKSKRKATGGIRATVRAEDKKLRSIGGNPSHTTITTSEAKREMHKKVGKTTKVVLKADKFIFTSDPQKPKDKPKKLEITGVEENNADRQFARRNVITKGAVLKAKDGSKEIYVKVTSRPGQQGVISGILLEKFEKTKEKKKAKAEKHAKKHEKAEAKESATEGSPVGDSEEEKAP
ncbi:MAG: 30S ribosomal protein S8e [Candidatus Diapherotrites archaeon]